MKNEQEARKKNKMPIPPTGGKKSIGNPYAHEFAQTESTDDNQEIMNTRYDDSESALPIGTASMFFRKTAIRELLNFEKQINKKAFPLSDQVPGVKDPQAPNGTQGAPWSGAGNQQNLNFNNNPNKRYDEDEWDLSQEGKKISRKPKDQMALNRKDSMDPGPTLYTGDE